MSEHTQKTTKQGLPSLAKSTIWMLSFGYLGVQTAFTLQSSQMSRIFQTLGADPHNLGWFFILPPLAGMLVQPIVGYYSDRTWMPRLGGRRLPYDMVNEEQKSYAYGIQSFLANTGAVVAAILPFVFAYIGLANTAEKGVVPQTVVVAFYVGAALLIITSAFTIFKVKEYDPETYARYHGIDVAANQEKANWFELLKTAPKAFWTVTLVQFFCWFAFQYMWTYSAGAIAENVWQTTDASSVGYQEAGNWYGVLAAVQSIAAVICSFILAKVPNKYHKAGYFGCLALGALGFFSIFFIHNQYALILSYTLIGIAWAGIITYPLTIVTNALSGKHMGTYLGLFNGSICMPQIVASLLSFVLFPMLGSHQATMFLVAGAVLLMGAFSVCLIKETHGE